MNACYQPRHKASVRRRWRIGRWEVQGFGAGQSHDMLIPDKITRRWGYSPTWIRLKSDGVNQGATRKLGRLWRLGLPLLLKIEVSPSPRRLGVWNALRTPPQAPKMHILLGALVAANLVNGASNHDGRAADLDTSCPVISTQLHLSDPPYENYFYSDCHSASQVVVTSPLPNSNLTLIGPRLLVSTAIDIYSHISMF